MNDHPSSGSSAGARPPSLVPDLVGREREFGEILAAWETVRGGRSRHVRLIGAAGLGKTRLLNDVHGRLRASGGRCLFLRANQGERRVPCAFMGALVGALAQFPGAVRVSTAAAGTLVALNPSLPELFHAAPADTTEGDDALRRRILAVTELVVAVADEAPLALLLDDLHWIDPASRQILAGAASRLMTDRVLIVGARRPTSEPVLSRSDTTQLTLEPLSAAHVSALLASLGSLPEAPWAHNLAARLHEASHGSPLELIETIQFAIERGAISLQAGAWSCRDEATLRAVVDAGSALRARVEELPSDELWLLLVLAVAGTPLPRRVVADAAPRSRDDLDGDLATLEDRGLAARAGGWWSTSHDAVADVALEVARPDAIRAAQAALGSALAAAAGGDRDLLVRAGEHLAAAGEQRSLESLFARWVNLERGRGDRRPLTELARDMVGDSFPAPGIPSLVRSLPFRVRVGLPSPARMAMAAAAIVLVGGTVVMVRARESHGAITTAVTQLTEDWSRDLTRDWVPFGEPPPTIDTGPEGIRAFWNQGDGRYLSGAYSRRTLRASRGLGIEAKVSTPLTDEQWQSLYVTLEGRLDSAALANWDHRTRFVPRVPSAYEAYCQLAIPGFEGSDAFHKVSVGAGSEVRRLEHRSPGSSWYTIRLQILPDGRCGIAIDGRPRWISTAAVEMDRPYRVLIQGNSVGTKMLTGPLEVWEGVRSDVTWSGFTEATRAVPPASGARRR